MRQRGEIILSQICGCLHVQYIVASQHSSCFWI